jgi:hypothetical protein
MEHTWCDEEMLVLRQKMNVGELPRAGCDLANMKVASGPKID